MTIGRRVVNVTKRAKGKEPIKYELEVIPYTAWEIPPEYTKLLFAWERGSKLFVTDAVEVRPNRSVVWKQFLKQTTTMYKGPDGFEAKDFAFKLQSVKENSKGAEERKTVAKVHIDLSSFCTGQVNPQPVEKTLSLKPFGKLKVSIKASWLKDSKFDPDAMTEMTGTSYGRGSDHQVADEYYEEEEQDLTGFAGGDAYEGEDADFATKRSSRSSKNGRPRSKHRLRDVPDDIQEGLEDAEEAPAREKRRQRERKPKPRLEGEDWQQEEDRGNQMQPDNLDVGMQVKKQTWKDYICCCLQPKVVAHPVDTQEDAELLSRTQKVKRSDR